MTKSTKATQSGKNWTKYINGNVVKLSKMSEKGWYQITVNGRVWQQTRGLKEIVRDFNEIQ